MFYLTSILSIIHCVQRIVISGATSDPNTTLVSGVTSSDLVFKFFAYSELRNLAMEDSPKAKSGRTALFGDQKIVPNLWSCLCRESLLILGKHYQLLLHRGSPLRSSIAPLPDKVKAPPAPDIGTPTKLLRQSIYKNVKESPGQAALDALASDGPIAQALDAGADATHIPELFRSMEHKVLASPVAEEAKKNVGQVKGFGSKLQEGVTSTLRSFATLYVPGPLRDLTERVVEWWKRERLSRKVEGSLAFRELDVIIIDGSWPKTFNEQNCLIDENCSAFVPDVCFFSRRPVWCCPERYTKNFRSDGPFAIRTGRIQGRSGLEL